jgi:hypothetical protein
MMYSLILSLLLACGEAEVDTEQQAKEQAKKELEKRQKKRLYQVQKLITNGMNDDGLKKGMRLYQETSNPELAYLLLQASHKVEDSAVMLEELGKSKLPKEIEEEIQFRLLLQNPDKAEAAAFAQGISDTERSASLLIEAIRAGAIVDSQDPLILAASEVIKTKSTVQLEQLEVLSSHTGMCTFIELALEGNRPDLALKYVQELQGAKDPRGKFCGLKASGKYVDALSLAHKKNLIVEGSALIKDLLSKEDGWTLLQQAQSPQQLIKKGSWSRVPYAKHAMHVGEYSTAVKLSTEAMKNSATSTEALYLQGMSSFLVRDVSKLTEVAAKEGVNQTLFQGLLQLAQGKVLPLEVFEGRTPRERIELVLYTAGNDARVAEEMLPLIITEADELGDPTLRVATRFMHESFVRTFKGEDTTEFLTQMLLDFGEQYPNLRTEIAIRQHLLGGASSIELSKDASISERAWQSYLAGAIPSALEPVPQMLSAMQILKERKGYETFINIMWQKTPIHRTGPLSTNTVLDLSHGLRFDDSVVGFVGSQKLEEVAQSLVFQDLARRSEIVQREAYLNRNPVFGMDAKNREVLLDAVARVRIQMLNYWMGGAFPEDSLAQLHGVEERLLMDDDEAITQKEKKKEKSKEKELEKKVAEKVAENSSIEESKEKELEKKVAEKVAENSTTEESKEMDNSIEETKPQKEEATEEKPAREKKPEVLTTSFFDEQYDILQEDLSYRTHVLKNRMDLNFLQSNLRKVVILSYRIHKGNLIGVAFSDSAGQVLDLGSAKRILELSARQEELLLQDRDNPTVLAPNMENHRVANTLKNLIFEPFNHTTQRLVSMVFVAPPELERMTFGTLPDQQNGLRFLNGMRRISSVPGLSELLRSSKLRNKKLEMLAIAEEVKDSGKSDVLRSGKENQPVEIDQISLSFKSNDRKVLIGDKSSLKEYRTHAPMARFIFFAQANSSDQGGFLLNGEELTLSEMSSTPLKAKLVFISEHPDSEVQRRRVHALLNAGARNIVVFDWTLPKQVKRLMLDKIFESLLRDEPITEAIAKISKNSLGLQSQDGIKKNGPGSWGALHLYGYPDRIGN